jgi:hypothetical protein
MKFLVLPAVLALAVSVAVGVASSASSSRSGALQVTKECSAYTGLVGSYCTITSSSLRAIKVGSKVVYAQAAGTTSLDSDITLVVGSHKVAFGHCRLDFATGAGLCTFSGGTGELRGFQARADVSYLGGPDWAWNGTYSFASDDD